MIPKPKKTGRKPNLRSLADRLWFNVCYTPFCELCGQKSVQVHHFYPKSIYPHLRESKQNGISLCQKCHASFHQSDSLLVRIYWRIIIKNRGQKWFNQLQGEAFNPPKNFKSDIKFYKDAICQLQQ